MTAELKIFVVLLALSFFGTIIVNVLLIKKRERERKEYLSREHLEKYEEMIASFLEKHNIVEGTDIIKIVEKIGCKLEEKDKLDNYHEAEKNGDTILVDKTLSFRVKNFGIAHEVAHIIKGDEESVARASHTFKTRDRNEQICDYIAAALLLPRSDIKNRLLKADYENRPRKERIRFISDLADEKNVSEEVVIRRIKEIRDLKV